MAKATMVIYNPFDNKLVIKIASDAENPQWEDLADNSDLLKYTNEKMQVLFSNIAEEVVEVINEKHNSNYDGLRIYFSGPKPDFQILEKHVGEANRKRQDKGELSCRHVGLYHSASEAIDIVKRSYTNISNEFIEYMPGNPKCVPGEDSIGNKICKFNEIISNEIPICIIGNYSVGKSAFVNALIGDEVLPSKVEPSTAKNVKIVKNNDNRYLLELQFQIDPNNGMSSFKYEILDDDLILIDAVGPEKESAISLLAEIKNTIAEQDGYPGSLRGWGKSKITHAVLSVLNSADDGLLLSVLLNVILSLPFSDPILSKSDSKIVFYDTPGSNNASLKGKGHRDALVQLLESQTNALPILVITKDTAVANDVSAIRETLDSYSVNFSSPNCLVVVSKADMLVTGQLEEQISSTITDWHGKSAVLYTAPVAAIGLKKRKDSEWIDHDYKEIYETWKQKYKRNEHNYILPEYNEIPCKGREILNPRDYVSEELYATGIPSVGAEILYYIEHFADYKKASRGRECLLDALKTVKEDLADKKINLNHKVEEAKERKLKEQEKLVSELRMLKPYDIMLSTDEIVSQFNEELDAYCSKLYSVAENLYRTYTGNNLIEGFNLLDEKLKEHCQEHLINRCYYGEGGIRHKIEEVANHYALQYMDMLQQFVSNNQKFLSLEGKEAIYKYIENEVKPPQFDEVKSILDDVIAVRDMAKAAYVGLKAFLKDKDEATSRVLASKAQSFEKRLKDSVTFAGVVQMGLFKRTAVRTPLERYGEQLNAWADVYRSEIEKRLESENAILSGMEREIQQINDSIDDITMRLSNVEDSEEKLKTLMDLTYI